MNESFDGANIIPDCRMLNVICRFRYLLWFAVILCMSLPSVAKVPTAAEYRAVPFRADEHSNEPLVELDSYGIAGESYYARKDGLNAPYYRAIAGAVSPPRVRSSVAKMLQQANAFLAAYGVEVFIWDGYRTIECQRELWNYFLQEAKRKIPRGTAADYAKYAVKYCSDPTRFKSDDPRTWTVHVTGGAVDLTLRRKNSQEWLYMGSIFDDASALSATEYYESRGRNAKLTVGPSLRGTTASDEDARRNRRLLYTAMTKAGFSNYPYEWWHYDYGDQMWSLFKGHGKPAFYPPIVGR
jgi:zinc D-Ala-D-Ala dipeptidase